MISFERLRPDVLEKTEALPARVVESVARARLGSRMSIFHTMGSPAIEDQTRVRDLLVVVDAGATYSPIPKPVADALVMRAVRRAIT